MRMIFIRDCIPKLRLGYEQSAAKSHLYVCGPAEAELEGNMVTRWVNNFDYTRLWVNYHNYKQKRREPI